MGSIRIFGTPVEWGLTRERHTALCAELSDHLECLAERGEPRAEREGPAAGPAQFAQDSSSNTAALAAAEAQRLAEPAVRRRLAGAHLVDQVCATLHRRPSREEWRELGWLGFWFVLIVLSDVLAASLAGIISKFFLVQPWSPREAYEGFSFSPPLWVTLSFAAWLLMGLARAGFFASFALSLQRAWQTGWGVCLGRIIQLKLIHTVLVVIALGAIGGLIEKYSWGGYYLPSVKSTLPYWLTAPVLCLPLALAGAAIWLVRRRAWGLGLFLIIAAFFLYPGGPATLQARLSKQSIEDQITVLSNGQRFPSRVARRMDLGRLGLTVVNKDKPNAAEIHTRAERIRQWAQDAAATGAETSLISINEDVNRETLRYYQTSPMPLHISNWSEANGGWISRDDQALFLKQKPVDSVAPLHLQAPQAVPGGGVGWLAAPIPFLTLIGLCGLVALLGRRSSLHMLLYCLLALLAMGTTLMPFFVGQPANHLLEQGPMAVMHTPFPGFEMLLVTPLTDLRYESGAVWMSFTLIGGLLLSAAIPWLMTGLFLKPQSGPTLPEDVEMA